MQDNHAKVLASRLDVNRGDLSRAETQSQVALLTARHDQFSPH